MKKITLFCGALLVAATMLFVACGKDKEATIKNFFNVQDATLVEDDMPQPSSNNTIAVSMSGTVITGGSSRVTVSSEVPAKKILVGMKDQTGYYEVSTTHSRDYAFIMMINQDITLPEGQTSFTVQVAIEDENGDISQIWEAPVSLKVVGTGALQVSLSFDNAKDVDLHLIEPEFLDEYGEPANFGGRHIYYGNHMGYYTLGELDLDSNAGCYLDYVNNENITYNDSSAFIPAGTYKVYVDMFENCDPSVATNYVVTVFYGGTLIASRAGIFDVDAPSTYNPIDEDYVANNEPFLTFTIAGNGQKCTKTFEPAPLTESAIEKEAISAANK